MQNIFNKKNMFILISIFLGFTISLSYNKVFNESFLVLFILISVFIYIIFYFLADIRDIDIEKFQLIRDSLEDINMEEEESLRINNPFINIHQQKEEEEIIQQLSKNILTEEEIMQPVQQLSQNALIEEEEPIQTMTTPNTPTTSTTSSSSIPTGYGPLNINISYNSQNSINELDNGKNISPNKGKSVESSESPNIGNNSDGRIHNNSDWIYGNNAWTKTPDFYIPAKKPYQNEIINARSYKENDTQVCPLMVNTPWTEYKSGDSEPEPYNL